MTLSRSLQITAALAVINALLFWWGYALGIGPCGGPGLLPLIVGFVTTVATCVFLIADLILLARWLLKRRQEQNGGAEAPPFTDH